MCIAMYSSLLRQEDPDASPPARCHDRVSQRNGETMMKYAGPVVFPASDLAKEKAVVAALAGPEPYADSNYYVGYR